MGLFDRFKKSKVQLASPMTGRLMPLSEVDDPVFAEGMMGDGFAVDPTEEKVYSPVGGRVTMVYETLHALGIETPEGKEILIHIGIDTVKLKGEPFKAFVQVGQSIDKGDLLMEIDLDFVREHAKSAQTCVLLPTEKVKIKMDFGEVKAKQDEVAEVL